MPALRPVKKEREVRGGWTRWIQPVARNYILACCDCGLCHHMDFRVQRGRVQFRARRAPAYTRAMRKTRAT